MYYLYINNYDYIYKMIGKIFERKNVDIIIQVEENLSTIDAMSCYVLIV